MGLIDLKTDLKSLRYGNDRVYGGNSGQPYITNNIPDDISPYIGTTDFLLRGGINIVRDSATDVLRLGKMFADIKSPNGLLFIAKQQLLSRTAVRTQTSGILNEGIYSPLNTLAEAGLVAFGGHLNKQGINPFAETGAYANNNNLYFSKVKPNPNAPEESTLNNRLVKIYNEKQVIKNLNPNVLTYTGGPGSILGIGNTNIRFSDQRTGVNNATSITTQKIVTPSDYLKNLGSILPSTIPGLSGKYYRLTNQYLENGFNSEGLSFGTYNFNVYEPATEGNTWPKNSPLINQQNTYTYNQKDIIQTETNKDNIATPKVQDFRAILRSKLGAGTQTQKTANESGATARSLTYDIGGAANFTQRVNIGDPGQRGNNSYYNYAAGVRDKQENSAYGNIANIIGVGDSSLNQFGLDKINSLPIYRSDSVTTDPVVNDFVKFRIAAIDNDSPDFKTFMHFRAFLGSISDSYTANWNGFSYLGRGEQFYTYGGFTRQISLSWTVAAQSKEELIPMYKKLNYLASTLAPDYSPNGYMRGNLIQLTIGGYLYEQPGFITGLTYEMGEESPWEIGIGSVDGTEDGTVKELCHIIKVTGFNFTPIHKFIPRKQELTFSTNAVGTDGEDTGFVQTYGNQQFIALANGPGSDNNNYNNDDTSVAVADTAAQSAAQARQQAALEGITRRGL